MEENDSAEGTLLKRVRELIAASEQTHMQICVSTGLQVNWLSGIATGRIRDPSVNRVQKLYEYLTGTKLAI